MSSYQFIERGRVVIENAELIFQNFSGKESAYNDEGNRNFGVIIDNPEVVDRLVDEGWNVRIWVSKKRPDAEPIHYIPVTVSFRTFPRVPAAEVWTVCNGVHTRMHEDTIGMLDGLEPVNVDLTIRPRYYTDRVTGKEKIKAYLHDMYMTTSKGYLARKYAEMESPEE